MTQPLKNEIEKEQFFTPKENILSEISDDLLKMDNLDKVLARAVENILMTFDTYSASIALLDASGQKLNVEIYRSILGNASPNKFKEFKIGEGIAGLAALKRNIVYVRDVNKSSSYLGKKSYTGGIISVPMISGNELVGVISLRLRETVDLSKSDIQVLTVLSTIISSAIVNSRLYEKMSGQVENLSSLFGIASRLDKVKPTIQKMIDIVPDLLDSERVHMLLFDQQKQVFESYIFSGERPSGNFDMRLGINSVSKKVFFEKKPYISNDARNDIKASQYYVRKLNIASMLSVPILIENRCYGIINIHNKRGNKFDKDDLKLAQIVASRIASRIENHNLIKKTETEKELFDNIIRNISDGVLVVNKSGKIIIWNKFLEDVTGIPSSQVIGHFGIDLALKLGVTDLAHGIIEALKNAKRLKNFYFEKKITTITGEQSWFGFTLSHLIETDGQLGDIVVVVRDISREKELLQAKNDFITTTTHELRTPLTSIKGYLSMLLHGDAGQLTQKQAQYFSKAYISTERLVQLVEDLLVALKIEENKIVLDIQACDINKIINESIENLAAKAAAKNMRIEYKSSPNKYLGMIDPIKTKHVFENLIDNAIKYTKKRGIINITLGKNEDKLVIEIKDNGIGIPKKYLSSIFERFSRIQSPLSVEAGGTGLGLFIVKNYIERQKGKIFVESEPGKGSSFIVELPSVIK